MLFIFLQLFTISSKHYIGGEDAIFLRETAVAAALFGYAADGLCADAFAAVFA